jgi:hypothetical protein
MIDGNHHQILRSESPFSFSGRLRHCVDCVGPTLSHPSGASAFHEGHGDASPDEFGRPSELILP